MFLILDGEGPRYRQLIRSLKSAVQAGTLVAGSRVPATRVLAQELGLSRNTVRVAYDQLIAEGFFEARAGSGNYVTSGTAVPSKLKQPVVAVPQSRYAARLALVSGYPGGSRRGLRFNLQNGGGSIYDAIAINAWRGELAHAALRTKPDYPSVQGLYSLRVAVSDYLLRRRGVRATPDEVLIVSATQQAMTLAARVLVDEGDSVALEEPHYFAARQVFGTHGAKLTFVRTDAEGLVCSELGTKRHKLVFVTPSHQFPGGSLMSMSRRVELLRYAEANQCWIFEDDYDSEFRYDALPMPALRTLEASERVIYAGSFSKVLFPSLRLGYMVVPSSLRKDFVDAKWLMDMGCPAIEQAAMARYISSGGFERHLRRIVQMAKQRRAALIAGLDRIGQGQFVLQGSAAGMHVVAWMPLMSHQQCDKLIEVAGARGLGLYPIAPHYEKMPRYPGLLLGYAALSVPEIEAAMVIFRRCLLQVLPGKSRGG